MGLLNKTKQNNKSPVKVTRKASRLPYMWWKRRRRRRREEEGLRERRVDEGRSQALLSQGGGHLVGQRGQLGGVGDVEAAGGRDGAQLLRGVFQRDDLGAVVSAGLGRLTEAQLVALNRSPLSL